MAALHYIYQFSICLVFFFGGEEGYIRTISIIQYGETDDRVYGILYGYCISKETTQKKVPTDHHHPILKY